MAISEEGIEAMTLFDPNISQIQYKLVVSPELKEPRFDGDETIYCPPELETFLTEYLANPEGWAGVLEFLHAFSEKEVTRASNNQEALVKEDPVTQVNIDQMPAGPAMDRLIAHTLGWKRLSDRLWHDTNGHEHWLDGVNSYPRQPPWSPSTDDALALTLLEQDRQQGRSWNISVSTTYQVSNYDNESVPLEGWNWDDPESFGSADTLALAICRAAYKATETRT